jgi:membrane protease YdiL (CAAX protease family)
MSWWIAGIGAAGGSLQDGMADPARLVLAGLLQLLLFAAGLGVNVVWGINRKHSGLNTTWLTNRMLRPSWTLRPVAALLVLLMFNWVVIQGLVWMTGRFLQGAPGVVVMTILFHWSILAFAVLYMGSIRGSWTRMFGMGWKALPHRLLQSGAYYLAALPVVAACTLIFQWVLQRMGVSVTLQEVTELLLHTSLPLRIYLGFSALVLAPLAEELLFRGILFPFVSRRLNVPLGMLLVSLLFALLHFHLASFVGLFLISMAFCFAYWRTGSLWVSIGMHMLFNAVNVVMLFTVFGA